MAMNLKDRYKEFLDFYHQAQDCFAEKNYPVTISLLRSALERLALIILCDIEGELMTKKLLDGEYIYDDSSKLPVYDPKDLNYKRSRGTLITNRDGSYENVTKLLIQHIKLKLNFNTHEKIQTRGLVFTAQKGVLSYLYKRKYKSSDEYENKKEYFSFQQRIWNIFREMGDFYGDGSKKVHPGTLPIDEGIVAENFLGRFRYLSEYLRAIGIWSEQSHKELGGFIKSEGEVVTDSNNTSEAVVANNEIDRLKVATCNFSTEQKYIFILPKYTEDFDLGIEENQKEFCALVNYIKPVLVIDLNQNTDDGVYKNISSLHDHISLIASYETEDSYIAKSEYVNWLFAQGNIENPATMNKDWLRFYKKGIRRITEKICLNTKPTNIAVISFVPNIKKLGFVFQTVGNNMPDASFYILSDAKDIEEECESFHEFNEEISLVPFRISLSELIHNMASTLIAQNDSTSILHSGCRLFFKGNSVNIPESEVISYREAGIELIDDTRLSNMSTKDNFYAGGEITWNDLSQHKDVDRDRWNDLLKPVEELINKSNETIISFGIFHQPGAGATTLSRRLAYEIEKKNCRNELQRSCNVVVLFKNIKENDRTVNQLIKLSQKIENNRLMVVYESCNISEPEIESIKSKLGNDGEKRKMFFVQVRPVHKADIKKRHERAIVLNDELSRGEFVRFAQKYSDQKMSSSNKRKMMDLTSPNVVDFPLLLHEGEVSQNLQRYIDNQMTRLSPPLQETVALLSFAYYYSEHMSVNIQLFRDVFKDSEHSLLGSYSLEERNVLRKLLLKDADRSENNYRPRYSKFAEFILQNYYGRDMDVKSQWNQYPSRLKDVAIRFIDVCSYYGDDGVDNDLFMSIFIQRRDDNYLSDDDKRFINKFSKLIQDINDENRADEVLKHLRDTFPDNPYYNAHYGRFLFERAKENKCLYTDDMFKRAKEYVDMAVDENSENSDVYHIKGMYYSRLVGSMRNTDRSISVRRDEILSKLVEWTREAEEAFATSEEKTTDNSEYAYAAEASLYRTAIELGRQIMGVENYRFCEEDPWLEYIENLGKSLSKLGDVCNNGETVNQRAKDIYGRLLGYYYGIFGNVETTANGFYQNAFNGRLSLDSRRSYGKLYFLVSIYGQMNKYKTDRRDVYRRLDSEQYDRLEKILESNIKLGDIESYDKLFELRLYGRGRKDTYTLTQAKDFVLEWHDTLEGKSGQSLLKATFYLGVLSAAQAIVSENKGKASKVYEIEAERYFQEASELALSLKKRTIVDYCAMGRLENDIRSIVRIDSPDNDKTLISGVFTKIKGDKSGVVRLDCGLEATLRFDDNEIPDEIDAEKVRYRGYIRFRYAGLAMYSAVKVK